MTAEYRAFRGGFCLTFVWERNRIAMQPRESHDPRELHPPFRTVEPSQEIGAADSIARHPLNST
jgi:hypothetical protein